MSTPPLSFAEMPTGRLLMADEPAQVTRDLLLNDPSLEPAALKVFARVTRPGYTAGVVAAFNVNKTAACVTGSLHADDAELPAEATQFGVTVYKAGDRSVRVITRGAHSMLPFELDETGFELFTLVPTRGGVSVFGLLDKYLGPAAVVSVRQEGRGVTVVRLREAGDFGAGLVSPPASIEVDGRRLPPSAYTYARGLLQVPRASFGARAGEREVKIVMPSVRNRAR